MVLNPRDQVWYGTNSERLAINLTNNQQFSSTEKFYEVDTKNVYIVYNNTWYQL